MREVTRKNAGRDVEAMRKRGLKVVHVDPTVEAEWRKAAENAYPRIRAKVIPADVFDEAKKHLSDFRKQRAAAAPRTE